MKWFRGHIHLQDKFSLFIYLGIFLWLVTIPVVYVEINTMNHHILSLEQSEDIYNTILEMRRYEKNFLLYRNRDDLDSSIHYLNLAKDLYSRSAADSEESRLDSDLRQLGTALKEYGEAIQIITQLSSSRSPDDQWQKQTRSIGKEVVDLAEAALKQERNRIGKAAKRALWWPVIFMGGMFLLFSAGAEMVTKKVIRPLGEIEKATEKIADGDFRPISHTGKMESQVDHLIAAFNRMVQELEARQEQLIHSRKISSLGTLISGTAHELNNPINNIILTIDTLTGSRKISEEKRRQLLDDILSQALRASEIVKNLLDFSRAQTSDYEDLDLGKLLRKTVKIAENQMVVSNVKLRDEISEALPTINGHRQGLQQVFLNMITNAVQAMPNGGELTIRAEVGDDNKIKVDFQDTGTGISEENLPNIFDPFFTTKAVGKGTGLGLSVSYGIIRKHGGQITVKSRVSEGTTFTVILPVKQLRPRG